MEEKSEKEREKKVNVREKEINKINFGIFESHYRKGDTFNNTFLIYWKTN
jgi:hypothetical protein